MHDGLVIVLLPVAHGPPVGGELRLVLVRDVVPLDLDVLVPVAAAVLVIEAHGVHHLVLDVPQQVGAPPDVDGLADGQRVESHADTTRASTGVLKYHVSLQKENCFKSIYQNMPQNFWIMWTIMEHVGSNGKPTSQVKIKKKKQCKK